MSNDRASVSKITSRDELNQQDRSILISDATIVNN